MTKTRIIIYQDFKGTAPLLEWLDGIPKKAMIKCVEKIDRLANYGHTLRRPDCDYLTDGIYELRARAGNVNYRILCLCWKTNSFAFSRQYKGKEGRTEGN